MTPELAAQRLQGRVALVTGGGGTNSIGRSISLRLAAEGAKVGVLDIDGPGAIRVADEIKAAGGEAIPITCDITHLDQCEAAAKLLADTYGGKIDILVNNAAAFRGVMSKQPWQRLLRVEGRGLGLHARREPAGHVVLRPRGLPLHEAPGLRQDHQPHLVHLLGGGGRASSTTSRARGASSASPGRWPGSWAPTASG